MNPGPWDLVLMALAAALLNVAGPERGGEGRGGVVVGWWWWWRWKWKWWREYGGRCCCTVGPWAAASSCP